MKMFFLFTDVAQVEALVGKEALLDKPNGTEGMFLRFLCSPKFPVLVQVFSNLFDPNIHFLLVRREAAVPSN